MPGGTHMIESESISTLRETLSRPPSSSVFRHLARQVSTITERHPDQAEWLHTYINQHTAQWPSHIRHLPKTHTPAFLKQKTRHKQSIYKSISLTRQDIRSGNRVILPLVLDTLYENNIEYLSLAHCQLSSQHIDQLLEHPILKALKGLDLSGNIITNQIGFALFDALQEAPLETLSLSDCSLRQIAVTRLAHCGHPSLQTLNLDDNEISDVPIRHLLVSLSFPNLRTLSLKSIFLDPNEHTIGFGGIPSSINLDLSTLHLSRSHIDLQSAIHILSCSSFESMQTLDVSDCHINGEWYNTLTRKLPGSSLKKLKLPVIRDFSKTENNAMYKDIRPLLDNLGTDQSSVESIWFHMENLAREPRPEQTDQMALFSYQPMRRWTCQMAARLTADEQHAAQAGYLLDQHHQRAFLIECKGELASNAKEAVKLYVHALSQTDGNQSVHPQVKIHPDEQVYPALEDWLSDYFHWEKPSYAKRQSYHLGNELEAIGNMYIDMSEPEEVFPEQIRDSVLGTGFDTISPTSNIHFAGMELEDEHAAIFVQGDMSVVRWRDGSVETLLSHTTRAPKVSLQDTFLETVRQLDDLNCATAPPTVGCMVKAEPHDIYIMGNTSFFVHCTNETIEDILQESPAYPMALQHMESWTADIAQHLDEAMDAEQASSERPCWVIVGISRG